MNDASAIELRERLAATNAEIDRLRELYARVECARADAERTIVKMRVLLGFDLLKERSDLVLDPAL
jgi:hypothetical protein